MRMDVGATLAATGGPAGASPRRRPDPADARAGAAFPIRAATIAARPARPPQRS